MGALSVESPSISGDSRISEGFGRRLEVVTGSVTLCRRVPLVSRLSQGRLWIASSIEMIDEMCFSECQTLVLIVIDHGSKLFTIGKSAFWGSKLTRILIPASVEVLCGSCFSYCPHLSSVIFEVESKLHVIGICAFCGSGLTGLFVPASVDALCELCLYNCKSLSWIEFETGSRLSRIEKCAFHGTQITRFRLPSGIRFLTGSSFPFFSLESVSFEPKPEMFCVNGSFIECFSCPTVIRYFGDGENIAIDCSIEIIGEFCFSECKGISSVAFGPGSQLIRIEQMAFAHCELDAIVIPASVEVLGE
jgi:ferredoxin